MVHLNPKRLWGSAPDRPRANYPHQIVIDGSGVDDKLQQRDDGLDAGYWQAKTESLEETVKELEQKVARLEFVAGVAGDGSTPNGSSTSAPAALAAPVEPAPAEAPAKKGLVEAEAEKQQKQRREQRKEDILQQLVAEMGRLMELHTAKEAGGDSDTKGSGSGESGEGARARTNNSRGSASPASTPASKSHVTALAKMWESNAHDKQEVDLDTSDPPSVHPGESRGEDPDGSSECSSISDDAHQGPKMDTSTLEQLLTTLLENEAQADSSSAPSKSKKKSSKHRKKKKKKRRKKKDHRLLYQLSCKQCIGRNFVGVCKNDELREKVKENYAVVWQVVRTAYGKGEGEDEPGNLHQDSLSFRA